MIPVDIDRIDVEVFDEGGFRYDCLLQNDPLSTRSSRPSGYL